MYTLSNTDHQAGRKRKKKKLASFRGMKTFRNSTVDILYVHPLLLTITKDKTVRSIKRFISVRQTHRFHLESIIIFLITRREVNKNKKNIHLQTNAKQLIYLGTS